MIRKLYFVVLFVVLVNLYANPLCYAGNQYSWRSPCFTANGLGYARINDEYLVITSDGRELSEPIYNYITEEGGLIIAYGDTVDVYITDEGKAYSGQYDDCVKTFYLLEKKLCVRIKNDMRNATKYFYVVNGSLEPIETIESLVFDPSLYKKNYVREGARIGTTESLCELASYVRSNLKDAGLRIYKNERYLMNALANKEIDLAIMYDSEYLKTHFDGENTAVLALDALVFYNNIANPIYNITHEYIESLYNDIYIGEYQVDDTIAFMCNRASDARREFGKVLTFPASRSRFTHTVEVDNSELEIEYINFPTALGYSLMHIYERMNYAECTKLLSVDGVGANVYSIRNGEYPFVRAIKLVSREPLKKIQFMGDGQYMEWVNEHGFIYPD